LESLSLSQKTINRKQYVLIFLFEVSYLKIDLIIYCGFVILHDYELVYYVLRLFGLNIVNVHNRFNDTDADAVISLWFNIFFRFGCILKIKTKPNRK
jgi:hypothetical protein